ncbi:hypothetical protein T484DRAFT_1814960, partial [Baffinella frigidus]
MNLSDNDLRAAGAFDLFFWIQVSHCENIRHLFIGSCGIHDTGAPHLAKLFKSKACPDLETLVLANNRLGDEVAYCTLRPCGYQGNQGRIFQSHGQRVLTTRVVDAGCAGILEAIEGSRVLQHLVTLDISQNEMARQGVEKLGSMLTTRNCAMESLDVSWNQIRLDAALPICEGNHPDLVNCWWWVVPICKALGLNKTLRRLKLDWNGLDENCCSKMADALRTSPLHHLSMAYVHMLGAMLLSTGLRKNQTLKTIRVDGNNIKQNQTLETMCVDGNNIKQMGARSLMQASLQSGRTEENKLEISTMNCNLATLDTSTFNKSEPSGEYSLDMEVPRERMTFNELLTLAMLGKGKFMLYPEPVVTFTDGSTKKYTIVVPEKGTDDEDFWRPDGGILSFAFGSTRAETTINDVISV